ncbi:LLM class flavin-dependent oxidoreductase [Streptomyces griseiscabiei]|uniref:LLM class flavin-dependent oxidoreductase n=1 Tax=Streptomyces griseiscabiei TaxID=2993540 RepID=A0ABU4LC05_9ACTN|nr:LLM class flavin-dependent oxidoreductase [Streptomyces griseiscabiei]MBZ3900291.1 LLM class flavin-dependent oxidoreductase [Streptomyces griseiscabiei]MDX2913302.1 LLM class flavin-dependent oxidoreductase [Streptomyces griseiscabiei]
MTQQPHELLFGSFITPSADNVEQVVSLTRLSERAGLDLATFQDHPYQPRLLDSWTLISYLAAATSRIRLAPNVMNLPMRQPVVIARSAASLDLLSGGRVELALGAGGFWEAIEAIGGGRLSPGESIDALEEAITVIREIWDTGTRGGVRMDGAHYQVSGAKRGPAPAHDIGIWVGAYRPRILRLVGRVADGWVPSLSYLDGGLAGLAEAGRHIDEGARAAGRDPASIRRLLNIGGHFTPDGSPVLRGPLTQWAEQLAEITLEHGVTGYVLAGDDPTGIQRFGEDVAPAVRELVEKARR